MNGELTDEEVIYMKQPPRYPVSPNSSEVLRLLKTLYGLKQAGRCWYQRLVVLDTGPGIPGGLTDTGPTDTDSDRHGYGIPGGYTDTGITGMGTDSLFGTHAIPVPVMAGLRWWLSLRLCWQRKL